MVKKQDTPAGRREPAYPTYAFRPSLKLADVVKEFGGGRSEVPKSIVSQHLGVGESSSGFYASVASAKCYGMIEGSRALSLTDISQRYFFPTSDEDQRQAELEFLSRPPAFEVLIRKFDGSKLPPQKMLANILFRDNVVPKSWSLRVAQLFITTATELNVIDGAGFLRYEAARHTGLQPRLAGNDGLLALPEAKIETQAKPTVQLISATRGPSMNVWVYREVDGLVRLETSDPLPRPLWERLKRYVDAIEPSDVQGGGVP